MSLWTTGWQTSRHFGLRKRNRCSLFTPMPVCRRSNHTLVAAVWSSLNALALLHPKNRRQIPPNGQMAPAGGTRYIPVRTRFQLEDKGQHAHNRPRVRQARRCARVWCAPLHTKNTKTPPPFSSSIGAPEKTGGARGPDTLFAAQLISRRHRHLTPRQRRHSKSKPESSAARAAATNDDPLQPPPPPSPTAPATRPARNTTRTG